MNTRRLAVGAVRGYNEYPLQKYAHFHVAAKVDEVPLSCIMVSWCILCFLFRTV